MKTHCLKDGIMLIALLVVAGVTKTQHTAGRIDSLMDALYNRGQFNGSILVSVNGKLLYEKAYGKADIKTNTDFAIATPCFLASVSKQFTAMAIMMLQEQKKLNYDDPISKYFPEFPPYAQTVTIQNLLTHTSGIINYEQLGIDRPALTNQDVFDSLVKQTSLRFKPGDKYEYSNSGYVLLALIIEKVSGMSYAGFMKKFIFEPLKMNDSFVMEISAADTRPRATAYGKFSDISNNSGFTTGDAGIVSTITDLYKWDKALYIGKLVSQATLNKAFSPTILNNGTVSPYGFGWMLKSENGERIAYHTGGSGGFRTYMERQPDHHNTIIILTNKENSPRIEIRNAIVNILQNKPYVLPKISVATEMYNIRNKSGIDSAIAFYYSNKLKNTDLYDFGEQELNLLGYKLWSLNLVNEAIQIFKLNVASYPKSSNAYESLGEAYLQQGDKKLAADSFNTSLSIDPQNTDATRMLKKLNNQ